MIEGWWSRIAEPPLKNLSYCEQDFYDVTFAPNIDGTSWAHSIILNTESPGESLISSTKQKTTNLLSSSQ